MDRMPWRTLEEAYLAILDTHPDVPKLPELPAVDSLGQPMFWCGTYQLERLLEAMVPGALDPSPDLNDRDAAED